MRITEIRGEDEAFKSGLIIVQSTTYNLKQGVHREHVKGQGCRCLNPGSTMILLNLPSPPNTPTCTKEANPAGRQADGSTRKLQGSPFHRWRKYLHTDTILLHRSGALLAY
jgi:hypothetical protein